MPSGLTKHRTEQSVYDAAIERINLLYDRFDKVVCSFSGGKDSTVVLNLTLQVARERDRLPLDVCFLDEECIAPPTVEYMERVQSREDVNLKWVCVPIKYRNACSRNQPYWYPWAEEDRNKWVRHLPEEAITAKDIPGFKRGLGKQEITPLLYPPSMGRVAEVRGIRTQESIRRLQSVMKREQDNWIAQNPLNGNFYPTSPIYDWSTEDVWRATHLGNWDYNRAYDLMALAGIPPALQRCTQPFGEEPIIGLWVWSVCFPELWEAMLKRADGVATAGRYAKTDLYGNNPKEPPPGMSWRDWCYSLLELYESEEKTAIAANIASLIRLHKSKTNRPIPDIESDPASGLSWKWLCKIVNRADITGRFQGRLVDHALKQCKKLGITYEEALKLDDTGLP